MTDCGFLALFVLLLLSLLCFVSLSLYWFLREKGDVFLRVEVYEMMKMTFDVMGKGRGLEGFGWGLLENIVKMFEGKKPR